MPFDKRTWEVRRAPLADARALVTACHYAKGGSKTGVYVHGLYLRALPDIMLGVAWWLPPTRVAAESVNRAAWQRVLSLTRMVVAPGVSPNACSFLLGKAARDIRQDGRFDTLVTWADESQGHFGGVYRACNWTYLGRGGSNERWLDAAGRQVATQAGAKTRTRAEMQALGYASAGKSHKHKFVLHLR